MLVGSGKRGYPGSGMRLTVSVIRREGQRLGHLMDLMNCCPVSQVSADVAD